MLKKIEAIIREDKLNDVKEALKEMGIVGLNVFEIRGHGRQGGISLVGRSGSYRVDLLPKIQVNIVLSEQNLDDGHRHHPQGSLYRRGRRRPHLRPAGGGSDPHPHPGAGP